ncbi:hypothetical protein [Flagellimonas lutimaris]|uniref:hypothetical protein n=1 Tax=Flagellimonas lutimaris TaxID=475082 RepID=UPI003F5CF18A
MKPDKLIPLLICHICLLITSGANGQEQLNLDYHSYIKNQIEEFQDTKSYYIGNILNHEIQQEDVTKLIITNKKEIDFLLENAASFTNLVNLHIYRVKLLDFDFLNVLGKLKILSLAQNRKINFNSLTNCLNKHPSIKHLSIANRNICEFPTQINQLNHLKSLRITDTKIENIEILLHLHYLDLSTNKKMNISLLKAPNVEIINLKANEINKFPTNLGTSEVLRALILGGPSLYDIDCPIKGFPNLEILDVFGTRVRDLKTSCFVDSNKLEIIQQFDSNR